MEGPEDAVHVAAAVVHWKEGEIHIRWQPVVAHHEQAGGLQHRHNLGQRHLVTVVLWQNHCRSDVARDIGITDVARDLWDI